MLELHRWHLHARNRAPRASRSRLTTTESTPDLRERFAHDSAIVAALLPDLMNSIRRARTVDRPVSRVRCPKHEEGRRDLLVYDLVAAGRHPSDVAIMVGCTRQNVFRILKRVSAQISSAPDRPAQSGRSEDRTKAGR